jgi:hypothetical protein
VVVAACQQVRLTAKKVADVNGRPCGLTEATHAARASGCPGEACCRKLQNFKCEMFSSFTDFEELVFQFFFLILLPPGPLDAQQMPLSSKLFPNDRAE